MVREEQALLASFSPAVKEIYEQIQQRKEDFYASVDKTTAFYAGPESKILGFQEKQSLEQQAGQCGFQLITSTRGGKWLDAICKSNLAHEQGELRLLTKPERDFLWAAASRHFAENAVGRVTCIVTDSREESVFRTVELPCLLGNEKVTHINGCNRELLCELAASRNSDSSDFVKDAHLQVSKGLVSHLEELKKGQVMQNGRAAEQVESRLSTLRNAWNDFNERRREMAHENARKRERDGGRSI